MHAAYNLARWLTRNDEDAQDVTQEACLRAFRFLDGLRPETARPWLLAIVRNTFFSWVERNRPPAPDAHRDGVSAPPDPASTEALGETPGDDPESLLLGQENLVLINQALERLPVEYREVLVLRGLEELSYKEIASVTATPLGTVMSRLSRGRRLLAQYLDELQRGEPDGMS